ncbi:MAG: hypothetical protein AB7G11_10910 [Phycisphaerales bacterium]
MTHHAGEHAVQTTRISKNWLIRMFVFMIGLFGFGTWGLYDATLIYPRSGLEDASFKLKGYLQIASSSSRLSPTYLKIENPAAELRQLAARESKQQGSKSLGSVKEPLTDLESARLAWLRSLDRAWKLGAEENLVGKAVRPKLGPGGTEIYSGVGGSTDSQKETHRVYFRTREGTGVSVGPDGKRTELTADQVLKDLTAYWTATKKTPSGLEVYDLWSQWVFVVVGYGGAAYILMLLLRVSSRKFRFDPSSLRLTVPGGATVAPADLQEVDKRRWHKYYVTLITKGGVSHTLDLMRYVPLEQWVLSMEKAAFPEAQAEAEAEEAAGEAEQNGAAKIPRDTGTISQMTYGGVPDGVFAVLLFDAGAAEGEEDYPAYAQGESLKAMAAALSKEHGWNLWLTAGAGFVGGARARVGGTPSAGIRALAEWLTDKGFGYQVDGSRVEAGMRERVRGLSESGDGTDSPYAVAIGRVEPATAQRLHEAMTDPVARGYAGLVVVKSNPATIERITQPLELEGGLEIKAAHCVGAWRATASEIEQAGLAPAETAGAE